MTPLDVQDHDWPSGGILMLIVVVSGFGLLCWYAWDVIGQVRRRREPVTATLPTPVDDLVPRDQLDAALAALTRTQIALAAERDARALRATLTTPTDA